MIETIPTAFFHNRGMRLLEPRAPGFFPGSGAGRADPMGWGWVFIGNDPCEIPGTVDILHSHGFCCLPYIHTRVQFSRATFPHWIHCPEPCSNTSQPMDNPLHALIGIYLSSPSLLPVERNAKIQRWRNIWEVGEGRKIPVPGHRVIPARSKGERVTESWNHYRSKRPPRSSSPALNIPMSTKRGKFERWEKIKRFQLLSTN